MCIVGSLVFMSCDMYVHMMCWYRNESYQEELWQRSIDMVKEFLSASSLATYVQPLTSLPAPETSHTEMRHVIDM